MNTIYAWGYGDILKQVLEGVALLFDPSQGLLITLAKIVVLLGFVAVLLGYFSDYGQKDPLRIVKFYVLVIGVWTVFMQVKTTVQIQDLQMNQVYIVNNVPTAIAKPLAFYSQVQRSLARTVDLVFSHPQACQYSETGFLGCFSPVNASLGVRITDPYLLMSFNEFIQNCILTNIADGSLNAQQLYLSDNLIFLLGQNLHPSRFTKVYADNTCNYGSGGCSPCREGYEGYACTCCSPCREGYACTCSDAWGNIQGRIQTYAGSDATKYIASITGLTQNAVSQALSQAPPYLYGISQTGTALLSQAIAINHVYDAVRTLAPGVDVAVGSVQRQTEQMGITGAITGGKYLPVIRGVLTVLVVALVPALFIFLFTPLAKAFIVGFITLFNWLTLWVFGEAVMHSLFMAKLHSMGANIVQEGLKPLSMLVLPVIQNNAMDYLAMMGNFYWVIPVISFAVATGFSIYGFKAVAGATGGQISGRATAEGIAMSNFSAGQLSFNNQSFGNTSFGNFGAGGFSFGGYSAWTTSIGQHQAGHVRQAGDMVQITGGTLGGNASNVLAYANKDMTPFLAAQKILGDGAKVSNLEMRDGKITSMRVVGRNGETLDYDGAKLTFSKGNTTLAWSRTDDGKWVFDSSVSTVIAGQITDGQLRNLSESISKAQQIQEGLSKATTWEQKVAFILQNKEFFESGILSSFGKVFSSSTTWTKDALRNYLSSEDFKKAIEKSQGFREEKGVSWQDVSKKGWTVEGGANLGIGIGMGSGSGSGAPGVTGNVGVSGKVSAQYASFSAKEGKLYILGSDGKVYSLTFTDEMKKGLTESYLKSLTTSSGKAGKSERYGKRGTSTSSDSSHSTTTAEQEIYNLTKAITESLQEQYTSAKSQSAQVSASAITQWLNARKEEYVKQGMDEISAMAQAGRDFHDLKTRIDRGDMNALTELSNYLGNKLTLKPPPELGNVKTEVQGVERDIQEGKNNLTRLKLDFDERLNITHAQRQQASKKMPDPRKALNSDLIKEVGKNTKDALKLSVKLEPRFTGVGQWAKAQEYLLFEDLGNLNKWIQFQKAQNQYEEDKIEQNPTSYPRPVK